MNRALGTLLAVLVTGLIVSLPVRAQDPFMFGVVSNTFNHTEHESLLINALTETDAAGLSFVVVNGIKSASESCSDSLYQHRYDLLNLSETAIILSLTASDWAGCNNKDGVSIAAERLSHIRELYFSDTVSLGQSTTPVFRQSILPQFRTYSENTRWESHGILFATLNVPSPNNHWVKDGGRNNEFEDRLIANKDWLHRLFLLATVKKTPGIVLFSDADFMAPPPHHLSLLQEQRDGFTEIRQQLQKLAAGYKGRILLVHNQNSDNAPTAIRWSKNIGHIRVHAAWMSIKVNRQTPAVFTVQALTGLPKLPLVPPPPTELSSVAP